MRYPGTAGSKAVIAILMLSMTAVSAAVRCPALFSDHMVLQSGAPVPVWGWAGPGEQVRVSMGAQSLNTAADGEGRWRVSLAALPAGGPHTLTVSGENDIRIEDVLVGEVWLCSGQSNMEWRLQQSADAEAEMAAAKWPEIRMFIVAHSVADLPQDTCSGAWVVCSPEAAGAFSAVGYFFGRDLHRQLKVPVGLIHSSWGGTPAEAWMNPATLKADEDFTPILNRYGRALLEYPQKLAQYRAAVKAAEENEGGIPVYHRDAGNEGADLGWAKPDFADGDWSDFRLPGFWDADKEMDIDGAVWFRKAITIPPEWRGRALSLELGAIDDFEITYFNGAEVGAIGEETPNAYQQPRKYVVPADLVKAGRAVVAVRVFDHFGQGGFGGYAAQMRLAPAPRGPEPPISLAGLWKMKVEKALDPSQITGPGGGGPQVPLGPEHPYSPAGLYNAMIHPLAPYALAGAIWYQGEANAERGHQYRKLLPAMIHDWRELWGQGDLPFGIVQLANFMAVSEEPAESEWAELREAQALAAKTTANAGLAVTIDIGEADDIHPRNKQDVGKRLSLWALANVYGLDVVHAGPVYHSMKIADGKALIRFENAGAGLRTKDGGEVDGFAIAGADGRFHWAQAQIQKGGVVVWSDAVETPLAVRYAWGNNPVCNLCNAEGLPAAPFRTDDFPGLTLNRR